MKLLLAWAALAVVANTTAQGPLPPASKTIAGQVVDTANATPLRRARVVITSGTTTLATVFTDDNGRFRIETTLPAPLTVRVTKATFAASQRVVSSAGDADLRVTLARSAAISGHVVDQRGLPVSAAYISARLLSTSGDPSGPPAGTPFYTQSDGFGEYRLRGLPPGRYEVAAAWIPREKRPALSNVVDEWLLQSDGVEIIKARSPLTLAPGDDTTDIEFRFAAVPPSCPPEPPAPTIEGRGTLSGRVSGPSGERLCAIVRIVAPEDARAQVLTDDEGRYSIPNLPAGSFIVEADPARTAFATLLHGQRAASDVEVPVTLRAGEDRDGTDIILPYKGIVSGRVLDEHGEPMEGASVQAIRISTVDGRAVGAVAGRSGSTDDLGRYHIAGLETGEYLVMAMTDGEISAPAAERTRGYAQGFFPATPNVSAAQRVSLDVNVHARDTDILIAPTSLATVSGVVVDTQGAPVSAAVTMTLSARSGAPTLRTWTARSNRDGRFALHNVPPGDYAVQAVAAGAAPQLFGFQYATVIDEQGPDLRVITAPPATVHGRVTVEGVADASDSGIVVRIYAVDPDQSPETSRSPRSFTPSSSQLQAGEFNTGYVSGPSRFVVETAGCERCYLKSAAVNGVDATDRPFDFGVKGGAFRDVEIVVSPAGATVEGRIGDARRPVVGSVAVVVFPTDRDLWFARSRHVKVGQSNTDGTFRVSGLPPGDYLVAAVSARDALGRARLVEQDALESLSGLASRVTLGAGQRRLLDLRRLR